MGRLARGWPEPENQPEYMTRWLAIPRSRFLAFDHARQLVARGEHRTPKLILENAELIGRRAVGLTSHMKSKLPPEKHAEADTGLQAVNDGIAQLKAASEAKQSLTQIRQLWLDLRLTARSLVLSNPDIDFEEVVYATRLISDSGDITWGHTRAKYRPGSDILVKTGLDPTGPTRSLLGDKLGPGHIRGLDLDFDADKVVFSYLKQPRGYGSEEWAYLYELKIDGTGPSAGLGTGLRQVTISRNNMDIEPCYLPSGKIAFITDRSNFGSQCAGTFRQDNKYTQLYTCDENGENSALHLQQQGHRPLPPCDGERGDHLHALGVPGAASQPYAQSLDHAPGRRHDGRALHGPHPQRSALPARSPPGAGHAEGGLQRLGSPQLHLRRHHADRLRARGSTNLDAMKMVTQPGYGPSRGDGLAETEGGYGAANMVPEGGTRERGGQYGYPYPLSDKSFLAAFSYKRPDVVSRAAPRASQFHPGPRLLALLHRCLGQQGADRTAAHHLDSLAHPRS